MKRLSILSALLAVALITVLVGCSNGGGNKVPAQISKSLWEQVKKGNYEKAANIWIENAIFDTDDPMTAEQKQQTVEALAEKMKESVEEKGGIKDFSIMKEAIDEEAGTAEVFYKVTYNDGTVLEESDNYRKVDGTWKINSGK